jgi:hypothetical protein
MRFLHLAPERLDAVVLYYEHENLEELMMEFFDN